MSNIKRNHQIIFINGYSGVGKTTLAKKLYNHYKSTYIEQNMIPEFISKDGGENVVGIDEEKVLYECMIALIKTFCSNGFMNILALDFDQMRFRDIPNDFKGYDYIILTLISSKQQNIRQMQNRENEGYGLIDYKMLDNDYAREINHPRNKLPNEFIIDVTGKTPEEVEKEAINILDNNSAVIEYNYIMPPKECFGTWIKKIS